MEHGPDFDDHRAAHRRDHNRDGAVRGAHDHAEHVHLLLPSRIAVDDRHQSVDHTAVQFGGVEFGDVEFGDVEFGNIEFGNSLTQRGDRGRRARDTNSEAKTSNQHHPQAYPASDQLTVGSVPVARYPPMTTTTTTTTTPTTTTPTTTEPTTTEPTTTTTPPGG